MKHHPLRILIVFLPFLAAASCDQRNLRPSGKPDLAEVMELRTQANTAYSAEDWDAAEKAYRELVEKVPAEAENWFRLGNIHARRQKYNEAVVFYREALVREPGHARAWHNLGITQLRVATMTFMEMQNYTEAGDPAAARARQIVDGVTRMLEESNAPEVQEDEPE